MIRLREENMQGARFLASEDYRYIIELHSNGFANGVDTATGEETAKVPISMIDSVISDMNAKFHEEFSLSFKETNSKGIKNKADKLIRQGYSCTFSLDSETSITISDKSGNTVFSAIGKDADKVVKDFEEDPVSFDTTISIEDYCLAKFL